MANRDYVKRGRNNKTTKKKNSKSAPSFPLKTAIIAALLIGVFGYGLFLLSNDPEPEISTPIVITPVVKPKPTAPEKEMPALPEEKWDYKKDLPKRVIEVEQNELKKSSIPYIMQCGAYKTEAQAESRKVSIAFQGLTSSVRRKEGSSWYRVVLGPYEYKRQAEKDRHTLQRAKIEPCAIWKDQ
ncbi:MAG: SPOR domain-containing protein [Aliivibrio sp.]|uniref:SPOR domain-containing protein n=1 Tax=Aliivibrio sp. TaxID=1872443 RepID=UPI001A5129DC|nr:SPOR domain-containing protein [Aliivibrio sp.]